MDSVDGIQKVGAGSDQEINGILIAKDGDQWWALVGDDMQEGEAGFGDDPILALLDLRSRLPSKHCEVSPEILDWQPHLQDLHKHVQLLAAAAVSAIVNPPEGIQCWKVKTPPGFTIGIDLPTGTITYQMPLELWDLYPVRELDWLPAGNSGDDNLPRLCAWLEDRCGD